MRTTPAARCDLNTALNAARGFTTLAQDYFRELPGAQSQASPFIARTRGAFTAAATNIALAVEIYLKAAAIVHQIDVLHAHDLRQLFERLPDTSRVEIEKCYQDEESKLGEGVCGIEIAVTATPVPPSAGDLARAQRSLLKVTDVRSLLSAESDAFVTWRYFFAEGPVGPVAVFSSHFRRLQILGGVLDAHIRSEAASRSASQPRSATSGNG